ncbi:hypothetical protein B9Z55_013434 [Caenorhabditis nigoni]|nr:hypothetical protein B9Z55_013434 [Caenorhabditis nigoni]
MVPINIAQYETPSRWELSIMCITGIVCSAAQYFMLTIIPVNHTDTDTWTGFFFICLSSVLCSFTLIYTNRLTNSRITGPGYIYISFQIFCTCILGYFRRLTCYADFFIHCILCGFIDLIFVAFAHLPHTTCPDQKGVEQKCFLFVKNSTVKANKIYHKV